MNLKLLKSKIKSTVKYFYVKELLFNYFRNKTRSINHDGIIYNFSTPNRLCDFRVKSLLTKEPETINWIDSFKNDSVFWDIGANVGMYSVYAAKSKKCKVYSFEPSVFNLEILARNIYLNKLTHSITIMPFAVNDLMGRGNLNMSSTDIGGALSSYDKTYGEDGEEMKVIFSYPIFAISMDEINSNLGVSAPDYIKIDVDGIELLILNGGINVLNTVNGLLIELSEKWYDRKLECEKILLNSGLTRVDHKYNKIKKGTSNQIWERIN
jgi:FkbM family methyltransferase